MLLGGCATAVPVEPWTPQPGTSAPCAALMAALDGPLGDLEPRAVDTGEDLPARAWGDPPVILRCGVPPPADYRPTSTLAEVNGIDWLPTEGVGGTFFTTIGRVAYVEVAVPEAHGPGGDQLVDLAPTVALAIPVSEDR